MMKRGTPAFVFGAQSKAVSRFIKNDEEGHRPFFFLPFLLNFKSGATKRQKWRRGAPPAFVFWAHSKAVSLNAKNGAERHRALVKHGNARAGERHQLVGHQMDEQVVIVPSRPLKVKRARSPERVLTPLSGILGTRSVGKPAMKLWRR